MRRIASGMMSTSIRRRASMNSRTSKFATSICVWIWVEMFLGPRSRSFIPRFGLRSMIPIWESTPKALRTL